MIAFHVDSNLIWVDPMKNQTEGEMILAQEQILDHTKACRIIPRHQIMDNKASAAYITAIQQSDMTYEKVPPGDHRRNIAKKSIQTWKYHFVTVLSGTAETFPLHPWCQLLP